jgi:hypothetical protein
MPAEAIGPAPFLVLRLFSSISSLLFTTYDYYFFCVLYRCTVYGPQTACRRFFLLLLFFFSYDPRLT